MKCPVHSDKDVIGYCIDCGTFGCEECLVSTGKGDNLCAKCERAKAASGKKGGKGLVSKLLGDKKEAKPARRASFDRSSVVKKGGAGRKLEVHYKNNTMMKGTTYKLDLNGVGFYLVPLDPSDDRDRVYVTFSDLKAIHFVKGFDGRSAPGETVNQPSAEAQVAKVAFKDGEILEGWTLHHFNPSCLRFYMVPKAGSSNNISILVERSALKGLEVGEFKDGVFAAEEEIATFEAEKKGRAPLSQNESMGDLYFSMKNYDSALSEYEKVREEYPHDKRLGLKISVCNFNRGVNFIKSRKYQEAKAEFEKIAEDDPIFGKAKKKIRKIDKILKEVQRMGT